MSTDLSVYCTKDTEYFVSQNSIQKYPFATSLLDFLYLDLSQGNQSHIYFDALNLDIKQITTDISILQKKVKTLFAEVFDVLPSEKRLSEKLIDYFAGNDDSARFSFSALTTKYEQIEPGIFADVLYPKSVEDIVDFFVRECLRRELRFKRCKCCGKYFELTSYSNTEYCDRLFGDSGKTCKQTGAIRLYPHKDYRRSQDSGV